MSFCPHHTKLFNIQKFYHCKHDLIDRYGISYLCHKWPRICSICRKHFPVLFSFMTHHQLNTTGATRGAGTAYPCGAPEFSSGFSGVRVTRSLVLYVCFVDRCLSFCPLSFGHCVVCSSSIYGFWLPIWYLQTLLTQVGSLLGFRKVFSRSRLGL